MPAPVADFAERRLGIGGTISGIDQLSPGLLRLAVSCPQPRKKTWLPGQEIEFRVGSRAFRHYTVQDYDADAGGMTVLFHLRGDGPGGAWLRQRAVGDEIVVLGPGSLLPVPIGARLLLLGDTSTIGTFVPMLDRPGVTCLGAVEVAADDVTAAKALLPGLDVIVEDPEPGGALGRWLAAALVASAGDLADGAYLLGHAGTIQRLRTALRDVTPLDRRAIVTRPYWATGRAGL